MSKATFTLEQIDWLRTGYRRWRIPELAARFNRRFCTAWTVEQIHACVKNRRMLSGRRTGFRKGEAPRARTDEQIRWLRTHRRLGPLAEVTRRFNLRFDLALSHSAVDGTCARYGIAAGSDGRYQAKQQPWNKGKTGYMGGNRGSFLPGNSPRRTMPVGSYRQDVAGYWLVKVSDDQPAGWSRKDWRYVHRLTWEAAHGKISTGCAVVFIDGNPDNCLDAANLEALSRDELVRLNQMGWQTLTDAALRRAAIAQVRLFSAAHRVAKNAGMGSRERQALIGRSGTF